MRSVVQPTAQASALWPFTPAYLTGPVLATHLISQLPSLERASTLIETYYTHIAWLRCPVDRAEVTSELMPLFYPRQMHSPAGITEIALRHAHELAKLFALFCLGAVVDLTLSADNVESARYYILSRASLGLRDVFSHATLSACQTLYLLATYKTHASRGSNQEYAWKLASLGATLAFSVCPSLFLLNVYSTFDVDWPT